MFQYADRPDLPSPILGALMDPAYYDGLATFKENLPPRVVRQAKLMLSATTLNKSPRQRILFARHSHKLLIDPLAEMYRMFGHVIHSILEKNVAPGDVIEQRVGSMFLGDIYVHGQADRYVPGQRLLQDWKCSKAISLTYPDKDEYHAQLNVLSVLFGRNDHPVERLENVFILRDWSANYVKEGSLYPKEPIIVAPIPVWETERVLDYIRTRAKAHKDAEALPDDELPFCTDHERWMSDDLYRVVKLTDEGEMQKVAKFKSISKIEAEDKLRELAEEAKAKIIADNAAKKKPKDLSQLTFPSFVIDKRHGVPRKCFHCEMRPFCNQFKAEEAAGRFGQQEDADDGIPA